MCCRVHSKVWPGPLSPVCLSSMPSGCGLLVWLGFGVQGVSSPLTRNPAGCLCVSAASTWAAVCIAAGQYTVMQQPAWVCLVGMCQGRVHKLALRQSCWCLFGREVCAERPALTVSEHHQDVASFPVVVGTSCVAGFPSAILHIAPVECVRQLLRQTQVFFCGQAEATNSSWMRCIMFSDSRVIRSLWLCLARAGKCLDLSFGNGSMLVSSVCSPRTSDNSCHVSRHSSRWQHRPLHCSTHWLGKHHAYERKWRHQPSLCIIALLCQGWGS